MMLTRLAATSSPHGFAQSPSQREAITPNSTGGTPPMPNLNLPLPSSPPRSRPPPFLTAEMGRLPLLSARSLLLFLLLFFFCLLSLSFLAFLSCHSSSLPLPSASSLLLFHIHSRDSAEFSGKDAMFRSSPLLHQQPLGSSSHASPSPSVTGTSAAGGTPSLKLPMASQLASSSGSSSSSGAAGSPLALSASASAAAARPPAVHRDRALSEGTRTSHDSL